jgi:hypothetical protein
MHKKFWRRWFVRQPPSFAPVSSLSPDPAGCKCIAGVGDRLAGDHDCVARAGEAAVPRRRARGRLQVVLGGSADSIVSCDAHAADATRSVVLGPSPAAFGGKPPESRRALGLILEETSKFRPDATLAGSTTGQSSWLSSFTGRNQKLNGRIGHLATPVPEPTDRQLLTRERREDSCTWRGSDRCL